MSTSTGSGPRWRPRSGGAGRVPAPDHGVGAGVVPGVLDEPPELLGPEVRDGVVGRGSLADDVRRDRAGALEGVVPVVDEQAPAVPARGEGCAVTDGVDVRCGGVQMVVGHHLAVGTELDA